MLKFTAINIRLWKLSCNKNYALCALLQ